MNLTHNRIAAIFGVSILVIALYFCVISSATAASGTASTDISGSGSTASTPIASVPVQTLNDPLGSNMTVSKIILTFMQIATYIAVLFGVILIVFVGFRYVLARGNPTEISKLHSWLLWIVVGLAVIIGARIIVSVIISTLQATGTVNPGISQNSNNALKTQ